MEKTNVARAPMTQLLADLPSVDKLLQSSTCGELIANFGREEVTKSIRHTLQLIREKIQNGELSTLPSEASLLKKNQDWVLDVVLDKYVNEAKFMDMPLPQGVSGPTPTVQLTHYVGQNTLMLEGINEILGKILMESGAHLRIGVANRKNRQISVMAGNEVLVQNIFQLSTGESILLNLFLSILRDFDLSTQQDTPLAEICGIVIIDEVDAHLHIVQQTQFLPKLIKLFPKIQFILTTHSPFFILGLNKQLGSEGFDIIELIFNDRTNIITC
jgi:hypothetical protein